MGAEGVNNPTTYSKSVPVWIDYQYIATNIILFK